MGSETPSLDPSAGPAATGVCALDGYALCWMGEPLPRVAVSLCGAAHQLEHPAGYRRVGPVHRVGVALGVAVHEGLLLLDVLRRLAPPPPVVDGLALPPLPVACPRKPRAVARGRSPAPEKPLEEKAGPRGQVPLPPSARCSLPSCACPLVFSGEIAGRPGTSSRSRSGFSPTPCLPSAEHATPERPPYALLSPHSTAVAEHKAMPRCAPHGLPMGGGVDPHAPANDGPPQVSFP